MKKKNPPSGWLCDNIPANHPGHLAHATELIVFMTHDFFSRPGTFHLRGGVENEDRISVVTRGSVTAAVVCDGAGSARCGAAAATVTAQTLAPLLAAEFAALFETGGAAFQLRIIHAVEQALAQYSHRSGAPAQELACTILAAAMDECGRCICLHLGDGILLQKRLREDHPTVVSAPMTGLAPHSTYLTMNCDLSRYLRCYRWEDAHLEQLLLLTDGAAEHLTQLQGGRGWVYTGPVPLDLTVILPHLARLSPRDDHSAVLLTRPQP